MEKAPNIHRDNPNADINSLKIWDMIPWYDSNTPIYALQTRINVHIRTKTYEPSNINANFKGGGE